MKRILRLFIVATFSFIVFSCSSFMNVEESALRLRKYEKNIYTLKKNISHRGITYLKQGARVKILFYLSENWIKVYAYPANEKRLKAKQVLILYMFDDDFPNEKYNEKFLIKKLYNVVK